MAPVILHLLDFYKDLEERSLPVEQFHQYSDHPQVSPPTSGIAAGTIIAIVLVATFGCALLSIPVITVRRYLIQLRRDKLLSKRNLVQPHPIRGWSSTSSNMTPPPTYSQSQGQRTPTPATPIHTTTCLTPMTSSSRTRTSPTSDMWHDDPIHIREKDPYILAQRERSLRMLEGLPVDDSPYVAQVTEAAFDRFCREMRFSVPDKRPEIPTPAKLGAGKKALTAPDLYISDIGAGIEPVMRAVNVREPAMARLRGPIHQAPIVQPIGLQVYVPKMNLRGGAGEPKSKFAPALRIQEYIHKKNTNKDKDELSDQEPKESASGIAKTEDNTNKVDRPSTATQFFTHVFEKVEEPKVKVKERQADEVDEETQAHRDLALALLEGRDYEPAEREKKT